MNIYTLTMDNPPRLELGAEFSSDTEGILEVKVGGSPLLLLPTLRCRLVERKAVALWDEAGDHFLIVPPTELKEYWVSCQGDVQTLATLDNPRGELVGVFIVRSPGKAVFTAWMGDESDEKYKDFVITSRPGGDLAIAGQPPEPVQWF